MSALKHLTCCKVLRIKNNSKLHVHALFVFAVSGNCVVLYFCSPSGHSVIQYVFPLGKHTVDNNTPQNTAKAFLCSATDNARSTPFAYCDG